MKRPFILAALAAATALGACAMDDAAAPPPGAPMDMAPTAAPAYVRMAAASDLFEIRSGTLARSRARSGDVRAFADMLVGDHTTTTQQLMLAARSAGLNPPPPMLMPMQRDMMARLNAASGADFDRIFLDEQVQAHQMALQLHQNYAQSGDVPALRTVAQTAVPVIQGHLERARALRGAIGGG
jgi:putative membrane protein